MKIVQDIKVYAVIAGSVMLLVIGGKWYYNVINKIAEQKATIEQLVTEISILTLTNTIITSNEVSLKNAINKQNEQILLRKAAHVKLMDDLNEWKNKPPEIKYINKIVKEIIVDTKYVDGVCDDGLKLNKMINGLNYDDL